MKQINLIFLLCVVHCFVFAQKITYDDQIIYNKKQENTLQKYPEGLLSYSYKIDNDTLILKISNFSKKTVITCNPCTAKGFSNKLIDSQTKEKLLLFHFFLWNYQ